METSSHVWCTPEQLAARLDAQRTGTGWRARCPAHGGDNPTALSIALGQDAQGHPCTLLYCHAYQCSIEAMCTALEIPVRSLFCVHPAYGRATRTAPRQGGPRIARLRAAPLPASHDDLAQLMLEEMLCSDPTFLANCPPARETLWRLAQTPARKRGLIAALKEAGLPVHGTLDALHREWGCGHG